MPDASLVTALETADIAELRKAGWKPPEVFVAKGRDGKTDIWGVIYRPTNFDASKKYPVIENIYAGPQGSFVPKSFAAYNGMQATAEDRLHRRADRRLGKPVVEGQVVQRSARRRRRGWTQWGCVPIASVAATQGSGGEASVLDHRSERVGPVAHRREEGVQRNVQHAIRRAVVFEKLRTQPFAVMMNSRRAGLLSHRRQRAVSPTFAVATT